VATVNLTREKLMEEALQESEDQYTSFLKT